MKVSVVFKLLVDLVHHLTYVFKTIISTLFVEVEPDILEVELLQFPIRLLIVLSQFAFPSALPDQVDQGYIPVALPNLLKVLPHDFLVQSIVGADDVSAIETKSGRLLPQKRHQSS